MDTIHQSNHTRITTHCEDNNDMLSQNVTREPTRNRETRLIIWICYRRSKEKLPYVAMFTIPTMG